MTSSDEDPGIGDMGLYEPPEDDAAFFNTGPSTIKPKLDKIFAEVQDNLPSIDFEVSDVSSDEEFSIFQRSLNTPSLIVDDNEKDLDESLTEDSWNAMVQDSQGSIRPDRIQSSQTTYDSEGSARSISRGPPKPKMHSWVKMDTETKHLDTKLTAKKETANNQDSMQTKPNVVKKTESKSTGTSTASIGVGTDMAMNGESVTDENSNHTVKEKNETVSGKRRKMRTQNGKKSLSHDDLESKVVFDRYMPHETTLSLGRLDRFNLSELLEAVTDHHGRESSMYDESNLPPPPNMSIYAAANQLPQTASEKGDEKSLIEKLAMLSMGNTGHDLSGIDPETGAIPKKGVRSAEALSPRRQPDMQSKPRKKTTVSTGASTVDLPPILEIRTTQQKVPKRDTVFIDLREYNKNKLKEKINTESIQRILHLGQQEDSSSDDDDNDEVGLWFEQRRRIRDAIETTGSVPKDLLQGKPAMTKPSKPRSAESAASKTQRLPRKQESLTVDTQPKLHNQILDDVQGMRTPPNTPTEPVQVDVHLKAEQEKQRRLEAARKLKEQKEHERQSRERLGKRLEALRPKTSVKGKQRCAEETPSLFDSDASYEPALSPLPPAIFSGHELTLLTVHLSSNGQIMMHRSTSGKSLDIGMGFPGSYPALLSWLLSLVPSNFSFLQEVPITTQNPSSLSFVAPFNVVGLQQIWIDSQLMLIIAVVPSENFDARIVKKPKGRDSASATPFHQLLNKFLTTNTLHTVCPWFSCIEPIRVTSNVQLPVKSKGDESYTYAAPIPSITSKPLSTFLQVNPDPQAVHKMFGTNIGFFWQTIDSEENYHDVSLSDENIKYDTQNTMSLVYRQIYQNSPDTFAIFLRLLQEGLDLSGLRLLFPTPQVMNVSISSSSSSQQDNINVANNIGPILALGLRGMLARSVWIDAVGPADPALARRTDPISLSAMYGGESREKCWLFCPRTPARTLAEISRWFGGRVPPSGVVDVGIIAPAKRERRRSGSPKPKKVSFADNAEDEPLVRMNCPPATLTAMTTSNILLVTSPLLPVKTLGILLSVCQKRGYQLRGVRRLRLNTKQATTLGITGPALSVFSPSSTNTPPTSPTSYEQVPPGIVHNDPKKTEEPPKPSTVLLLQKENGLHYATSLIEAIMIQLCLKGVLGNIQESLTLTLYSGILFQAAPFMESSLKILGGEMYKVPEHDMSPMPGYISPQLHSNPEAEEIVTLTLTGHLLMKTFGLFLAKLLNLLPHGKMPPVPGTTEGFELLGIKWLPSLSIGQAKELTPYEVGDKLWKPSIHTLTSEPAVVVLLRGVNAFKRIQSIINTKQSLSDSNQLAKLDKLMSPTPELAYRLATLFFFNRELFSDNEARTLLEFIPPARSLHSPEGSRIESSSKQKRSKNTKSSRLDQPDPIFVEESIFKTMISGPRPLATVLLIKPRAVKKHLSKILKRVIVEGFVLVGLKMKELNETEAESLLNPAEKQNDVLRKLHMEYLVSSPCLIICIQRENAIKKLVDLIGPEDPVVARRQGQLLWRGMYGTDVVNNAIYASPTYSKSVADVNLFFKEGLCCVPTNDLKEEKIFCPAVDSIIDVKLFNEKEVDVPHKKTKLSGSADLSVSTKYEDDGSIVYNDGTVFNGSFSALMQTNCIVLSPRLLQAQKKSKKFGYIEIIDTLLSHHFEVVGARMIWFTEEQAEHYLHLCNAGSYDLVPLLTSGPSIVLALERDNAVMVFDSLLGSPFQSDSISVRYGEHIMKPNSITQANRHLVFFFNELSPSSQAKIRKHDSH